MHIRIIVFYEHSKNRCHLASSMLVTDGAKLGAKFNHVRSLDIRVRHQYIKYVTKILLLSPTSEKCHQFLVAKIMLVPTSYKPYYIFSTLTI